jgi:tight adherence protein B
MWLFVALVFLAAFLLAQGLSIPVFGENRRLRKQLRARLAAAGQTSTKGRMQILLRERYLKKLSPLEQRLESLPGIERLANLMEQSGRSAPAYRVVGLAFVLGAVAALTAWIATKLWYLAALGGTIALLAPVLRILRERAQRRSRFEEQLPEALDVVKRALRAGHPFTQSLQLVATDMDEPIRTEFEYVFTEISYGGELRAALLRLLERMPSVSVTAFVTAVMIQKETGGNLAETLDRITAVIRARFRFQRRVRTLSAEGRLSAWILLTLPVVLFVVLWFTTPGYLNTLINNPKGPLLITLAGLLGSVGILWIRRIIRIDV